MEQPRWASIQVSEPSFEMDLHDFFVKYYGTPKDDSSKGIKAYIWDNNDFLTACFYKKGKWVMSAEVKMGRMCDGWSSTSLDDKLFVSYLQHYTKACELPTAIQSF